MYGWGRGTHPISGYFWLCYTLGGQGERTVSGAPSLAVLWWRVQSLHCCAQLLFSGLVWHGAVGYLLWELIPFSKSSCLPERDLASGSCIGLTPRFVVCQRNHLPKSDDWGALMASLWHFFSQELRGKKFARRYTKTSMVKKKKKKKSWKGCLEKKEKENWVLGKLQNQGQTINGSWRLVASASEAASNLFLKSTFVAVWPHPQTAAKACGEMPPLILCPVTLTVGLCN